MTSSFPNPRQKSNHRLFLGTLSIVLIFVLFAGMLLTIVAQKFGDGSAYSTGFELGRMLKGMFGHFSIKKGLGIGTVIAMLASWERNKSIRWVLLHAIFGWGYVLYFVITRKAADNR